jgi:heme/copper-type cytochrome/quinol oxidase subunit 1
MTWAARAVSPASTAEANPWGAGATTLEWTLPSPVPFHTFDTLMRIT